MNCPRCSKEHNGVYGQRCEDCWAVDQEGTGEPAGVPYVSGLGERRPLRPTRPANPDFLSLLAGQILATF